MTTSIITFDTTDCTRCGGSGEMPFAAFGGACFKCNRTGRNLTRAGQRAYNRVEAWKKDTYTIAASSVRPGYHRILDSVTRKWLTVTEVTTTLGKGNGSSRIGTEGTDSFTEYVTYGKTVLSTRRGGYQTAAHAPVVALPPAAEYREALAAFAATIKSGVTVNQPTPA